VNSVERSELSPGGNSVSIKKNESWRRIGKHPKKAERKEKEGVTPDDLGGGGGTGLTSKEAQRELKINEAGKDIQSTEKGSESCLTREGCFRGTMEWQRGK